MSRTLRQIAQRSGQDDCASGNGYTDPNGVFHCPTNLPPTCPSGQHVMGNYNGVLICAPNTCPDGTHMGWTTDGSRVVCTPNTANVCPAGYTLDVYGSCVPSTAITPTPTAVITPTPIVTQPSFLDTKIFGLSPITLALIAGGAFFLFKK